MAPKFKQCGLYPYSTRKKPLLMHMHWETRVILILFLQSTELPNVQNGPSLCTFSAYQQFKELVHLKTPQVRPGDVPVHCARSKARRAETAKHCQCNHGWDTRVLTHCHQKTINIFQTLFPSLFLDLSTTFAFAFWARVNSLLENNCETFVTIAQEVSG